MKHQPDLNDLFAFLDSIDSSLQSRQCEQIGIFHDLLNRWSAKQNLVSRTDRYHLVERHFLPSLFLNACLPKSPGSALMDLGSGAGFPGVLIAIMRPDLSVTLLDSSRKKTLFLEEVREVAGLKFRVLCRRCEDYSASTQEKYQFIVSRAVARIDVLLKWSGGLLDKGGALYALKGGDEVTELVEKGLNASLYQVFRPGKDWLDFSDYMKNKYILKVGK